MQTNALTSTTPARRLAAPNLPVRAGLRGALAPAMLGALLWVAFLSDVARPPRAGAGQLEPGGAGAQVASLAARPASR